MPAFAARYASLCACLGILVAPTEASAQTERRATFSVPIQATAVAGGASKQQMLVLPNSSDTNPAFYFDFVIPRGYKPNGEIRIVLYVTSPAAPCYAKIRPVQLIRSRVSEVPVDDQAGFGMDGVTLLAADGRVAGQAYLLRPDGPMVGQRPSDGITVGFARQPNHRGDTCNGSVFVRHIDVRYPLAP